jgi:hypothetical protein
MIVKTLGDGSRVFKLRFHVCPHALQLGPARVTWPLEPAAPG